MINLHDNLRMLFAHCPVFNKTLNDASDGLQNAPRHASPRDLVLPLSGTTGVFQTSISHATLSRAIIGLS